jgi:signal transduction histidine kinase
MDHPRLRKSVALGAIRTRERLTTLSVFKTDALSRSATSPLRILWRLICENIEFVTDLEPSLGVELIVADTGVGMSEEVQEHPFRAVLYH